MDKKSLDFWDVILVLGGLSIIIWALLKAFGIIHSPTWVEMIPVIGAGASILGGTYKLGKIKKGIEQTEEKVEKILQIEDKFSKLESEHNLAMSGKLKIKH